REGVDARGLDRLDRRFLTAVIEQYGGGPVGLEAVAATINDEAETLAEMVEPYLLKIGFIVRSPNGRRATREAYLHLGTVPPAAGASTIRVAVLENARAVEFRGADLEVTGAGECPRCGQPVRVEGADILLRAVPRDGGVEIDGEPFGRTVRVRSAATIRVNGREYVGDFEVATTGDAFAVINELPLEQYVAGSLKAEAPETWPREALRAQAIVVRTYAAYQRQLNAARSYHIVASTAD